MVFPDRLREETVDPGVTTGRNGWENDQIILH